MLRAHLVDRLPVTEAAVGQGYSRAAFYPVSAPFDQLGMAGLLDAGKAVGGRSNWRRRSWSSSVRLPGSGAQVADQVADRFGARCTGEPWNGSAARAPPGRSGRRPRRVRSTTKHSAPNCSSTIGYPTGWPLPGSLAAGVAGLIASPARRTGVRC